MNDKTKKMLTIKPLKSGRDKIKLRPLMDKKIIPAMGAHLFIGRTGSGKTNALCHLFSDEKMLKGFYDYVYLFCFSPATLFIDHCDDIKENNIIRDDDPKILGNILEFQKNNIEEVGFEKSPKLLFILDDVATSTKFLNSKPLKELFFSGTNYKCTCFLLSQYYVSVPKKLRTNAHTMCVFNGVVQNEIKRLAEEHCPAEIKNTDRFIDMVNTTIEDPHSFIFCNCTVPDRTKKFRKNFSDIIDLKPYIDQT